MSDSESMLSDLTLSDGVQGICSSQTFGSEKRDPKENRKEPSIKVIRHITKGIKSFTSLIKYSHDSLWLGDDGAPPPAERPPQRTVAAFGHRYLQPRPMQRC